MNGLYEGQSPLPFLLPGLLALLDPDSPQGFSISITSTGLHVVIPCILHTSHDVLIQEFGKVRSSGSVASSGHTGDTGGWHNA